MRLFQLNLGPFSYMCDIGFSWKDLSTGITVKYEPGLKGIFFAINIPTLYMRLITCYDAFSSFKEN